MIPSAFRDDLVEGATVTRGIERCLLVYPATEWRTLAERIRRLPLTNQSARAFNRFIFSGAAVCPCGHTGKTKSAKDANELPSRLPLPDQLRRYAHIEEEAIVVGLLSHLEIWSPERWRRAKSSFVEEGVALAEALSESGI